MLGYLTFISSVTYDVADHYTWNERLSFCFRVPRAIQWPQQQGLIASLWQWPAPEWTLQPHSKHVQSPDLITWEPQSQGPWVEGKPVRDPAEARADVREEAMKIGISQCYKMYSHRGSVSLSPLRHPNPAVHNCMERKHLSSFWGRNQSNLWVSGSLTNGASSCWGLKISRRLTGQGNSENLSPNS